jgi:ribosome-associated protein
MAAPIPIAVDLPITLGQFVKLAGLAATGGDAKRLVVLGLVHVNGEVDRRRGHKLASGDIVEVQGEAAQVVPGCRSGG